MATSQNPNPTNPTNINVNINDLNYYAELQNRVEDISKTINNIISSQEKSGLEAANIRNTYRDLGKELKNINALADKYNNNELKTADISKLIIENERISRNLIIAKTKAINEGNDSLAIQLERELQLNAELNHELESLKEANKEIDKRVGLTGKLIGMLGKIPIIGNFINAQEAVKEMRALAKEVDENGKAVNNQFKIIGAGIKKSFEEVSTAAVNLYVFKFLVDAAFKADKQVTDLAKSLVITKEQANEVRNQFVGASLAIGDSFITTSKLLEAQAKLADAIGVTKIQSIDLTKEFVTLTGKIGISDEAATGLSKTIIASGKNARQITSATVANIERIKQETGLRLDNKKVLEATGKISGQLLANFKGSAPAIAEAIARAQALGTTLEQTKSQAETLLNFETSIENELKAELITCRQINLERARMAALMGDQITLAKELSDQAVDFNTFSNMNVIAQKSLAEALGLSTDQLSDQLFKQQYLNKSREQILALGGEEALQRMEQLSAQDKFNNAVEKLKELLGNLMAGPLGRLIDGFANLASSAGAIYTAMAALAGLSLFNVFRSVATLAATLGAGAASAITIASAVTFGLGLAGVIAGIYTTMSAYDDAKNQATEFAKGGIVTQEINNATVGEAGPEAIIPLNSPKANNILGGNIDVAPIVNAISELRNDIKALGSRPSVAYIQGEDAFVKRIGSNAALGSTQMGGTYRLA